MPWIGLLLGALTGAFIHGFGGMLVGAAAGWVIGLLLRRSPYAPLASATEQANARRIVALEQRLNALESAIARSAVPPATAAAATDSGVASLREDNPAPTFTAAPAAEMPRARMPAQLSPVRKGGIGEPDAARSAPASAAPQRREAATSPAPWSGAAAALWSWFTDGNAVVRVGIVVLFFGVAFLLSYLVEHVTVPIELQFVGVALAGGALIGAGAILRRSRRAYALALAGGGLGVLYLTTFAAFQLVPLLAPASAFALLAAIALLAIALSLAFDAQALAALAVLGGLLAPALVETVTEPLLLFGYVAAVNALVLAIAWFRAWRALDIVGFVGTFVLGLWWGYEFYAPAHFATVEPFLAAFFLAYLAVPILHAFRGAAERRIDALLIFGVPVVGLALQALLVHDSRHALAWTTAVVALLYGSLWLALRQRTGTPATLASAFGALAVIFATITVPLAVDARWTSGVWAIEAAGIYWLGCRENRELARGFALLLQFATGIVFLAGGFPEYSDQAFLNRQFLGIAAIALAAFAAVCFGDRRGKALPEAERLVLHLLFGWACIWWVAGGLMEIASHVGARVEAHAMLAWVVGSVGVGALLSRALRWRRLDAAAIALLPALALAFGHDVRHGRTSVTDFGWAVYPLAWALHFVLIHRGEMRGNAESDAPGSMRSETLRSWVAAAHLIGALLLVGQIAWESGEWTARATARDTVWSACAYLLPLVSYLTIVTRTARSGAWPMTTFGKVYAVSVGTVVAVALGLGVLVLALLNPGDARPLPYVPVANPLELTVALALAVLFPWARQNVQIPEPYLYRWVGVGAFVLLNGMVARTVHHWLGVPWRLEALLASRPLQAALTLTWTLAALATMVVATRRRLRAVWLAGAGLLAAVVIKLFAIDLAALSGLSRVVAFLGVGALLLVIGYVTPLPPVETTREKEVALGNGEEGSRPGA
jgi:uncharacterized membrane protein